MYENIFSHLQLYVRNNARILSVCLPVCLFDLKSQKREVVSVLLSPARSFSYEVAQTAKTSGENIQFKRETNIGTFSQFTRSLHMETLLLPSQLHNV